jgi:hypothetical protein
VLKTTAKDYNYKFEVRSRYHEVVSIELDLSKISFMTGIYKPGDLGPGCEHVTKLTINPDIKTGEYSGHAEVSACCAHGKEALLVPVYLKVVDPASEEGQAENLKLPKHAFRPFENTKKIEKSRNNTLAFKSAESRGWNS